MLLNELLEEIRYGKEYVSSKNTLSDLESMIDEDYKILKVSERVSSLLKECDMTKSFTKKLARAARNYKSYEDRILEGTEVTSIYSKLKADMIVEDINIAITELESNKKVLRESNQENLGKAIAALKFGVKTLLEGHSFSSKKINESDSLVKNYVNKEFTLIESIV